jgi:hypothetical protein
MWSVRVVTRTHISQYTVVNAPRAMLFEIPHSQRPTPRMNDNYQGYYQDYNVK